MSNFRWSFGIGPIRYNAPIGGGKRKPSPEREPNAALGIITLVVAAVVIICCCCMPAWDAITK